MLKRSWRFLEHRFLPNVREVMAFPIATLESNASVMMAVQAMADSRVSSVVVIEGENPVGIFTGHDLLDRVMKENRDPSEVKVKEIMSKPLITVGSGDPISAAVEKLHYFGIGHLVVMDEERLVGVLTDTDIRLKFSSGYPGHMLLLKKFAIDVLAYAIFWSSFSYLIQVFIVGIEWNKYVASSALGWVVTIVLAGPYGRFLDIFRRRFHA